MQKNVAEAGINQVGIFSLAMLERSCYYWGMERSKKKKRSRDPNELAASIVGEATGKEPAAEEPTNHRNPAAVALGRLGGLKGGKARAKKLSAKRRKAIASKAAKARWGKPRKT